MVIERQQSCGFVGYYEACLRIQHPLAPELFRRTSTHAYKQSNLLTFKLLESMSSKQISHPLDKLVDCKQKGHIDV